MTEHKSLFEGTTAHRKEGSVQEPSLSIQVHQSKGSVDMRTEAFQRLEDEVLSVNHIISWHTL